MREGWQIVKLGEVCKFQGGSQPPKSKFIDAPKEGYIRLLQIRDFKSDKRAVYIPEAKKNRTCIETDIMIGRYGASVGQIHRGKAGAYNVALIRTSPNENVIYKNYFYYFLISSWFQNPLMNVAQRSAQAGFSKDDIHEFQIPLPPPAEQERIVSILDKAFEGIDKAIAQTEQNLASARELFEGYLNNIFTQKGDDWVEKKLGDCIKLKSGDGLTAKNMNPEGCFNVYGGNGIAGLHDAYNTEGDHVIIGRVGALCGNARHLNENFWLTDNAFRVSEYHEDFDLSFLTFLLNYKNLRSYARQAAQPVVSNSSLKEVVFSFPLDVETQRLIAEKFDFLRRKKQQLEALYTQKLNDLKELKQSLLQQAFAGELTKEDAA
ncbi:restriction endonuclease subunit S [bacterium]|nr:restriction endonuclease subunit S [bacterium]MDB4577266.1 restriction endonuclease subunit S [bacterium]